MDSGQTARVESVGGAQAAEAAKAGFFSRYKGEILLVGMTIYVLILGVATVDELFDLGIFPPELEKQIAGHIEALRTGDETAKKNAETQLLDIGHFALRQLIAELKTDDLKLKSADLLGKICADLDLDGQAARTVEKLGDRDAKVREQSEWELVEIGHFGLAAQVKALTHIREDIRLRMPRIITQTTSFYFGGDPWLFEERDADAVKAVRNLANPSLCEGARSELMQIGHFAKPALLEGLRSVSPDVRQRSAEILAKVFEQNLGSDYAKWEESNAKWWQNWYEKHKDTLGFGSSHRKWKLWYRMNKDHL